MRRGLYETWTAIREALLSINGLAGGYWLDWSERVFPVLVTPEDGASMPDWWACMPMIGGRATNEPGPTADIAAWVQPIVIFVPENASDPLDTKAIEFAAHAVDDVRRMIRQNGRLGSAVVSVADWEIEAGVGLGDNSYGEAIISLAITQTLSAQSLGPLA